jgi:hypothetical protein
MDASTFTGEERARLLRECGPTVGLSTIPDPVVQRLDRLLLEVLELRTIVARLDHVSPPSDGAL